MNDNEQNLKVTRSFLVAAVLAIACFSGCTANSFYQERLMKETVINKGGSAIEASCAWSNQNPLCSALVIKQN
jgi:hypothetical protein